MERRVRKMGQHRGWTPKQMAPDAVVKDIVESIRKSHGSRTAAMYTTDATIIAKVEELLAQ
jgi:hypothetical protein